MPVTPNRDLGTGRTSDILIINIRNHGDTGMSLSQTMLSSSVDQIAAKAADVADVDELVGHVRDFVERLTAHLEGEGAPDAETLRKAIGDDAQYTKLLRAVTAECIEALRASARHGDHGSAVLKLREAVSPLISEARTLPGGSPFYEALLAGDDGEIDRASGRLLSLFRGMMQVLHDMAYIHDAAGHLLFLNEPGLAMAGYTREDIQRGLNVYDLVVPECLDLVEARLESPGAATRAPYTIEIYTKDGERIPVEITTQPLIEDGQFVAVLGIARDMRLERRLERSFQRNAAYLQTIIANAPFGIITTDAQAVITDANPAAARLYGAQKGADLAGVPVYAVSNEADERLRRSLMNVLENNTELCEHYATSSRFGTAMNCELHAIPIAATPGSPDGLLLLFEDLSERVAVQDTLESEKLSALGEMVRGMAHELNNPLTGILGYAQYLLSADLAPECKRRLDSITQEAARCKRIVDNLLDFCRQRTISEADHDINEIVSTTLALCEYQLSADDIILNIELTPKLPPVRVSPRDIQRALLNVVNNAQKALLSVSGSGRKLSVTTEMVGEYVAIRVADNGPGIPPERQRRIFEPFFTTRTLGDGTGMGLSAAYGIAKAHGGDLTCESREGEGTVFTIRLPRE